MQHQESVGRWDGLGSRDASSRAEAMEFICQEVMRKVEAIEPIKAATPSSPALGSPPNSDLNDILVHLLMLSRRCPFGDVRERCSTLLRDIQVGNLTLLLNLFVILQGWLFCCCCHLSSSFLHLLISIANIVVQSKALQDYSKFYCKIILFYCKL